VNLVGCEKYVTLQATRRKSAENMSTDQVR
jgi:hypothetical protein